MLAAARLHLARRGYEGASVKKEKEGGAALLSGRVAAYLAVKFDAIRSFSLGLNNLRDIL